MKVLIFDIYGDYAHFKKYYTTSSPLTLSFPPPPTIKGMLGAICGKGKDEYLEVFSSEQCKVGIRILKPIKKVRMGLNHINTKDGFWIPVNKKNHQAHTQICTEFLKDPVYRIYFSHQDDELFEKLTEMIKEHKTVFTLSLGLSELLADFKYVGQRDFTKIENEESEIHSIVPIECIKDQGLIFADARKYFKEKIPVDMIKGRIVSKYQDILFESEGKSIHADMKYFWEGQNGERVVFF